MSMSSFSGHLMFHWRQFFDSENTIFYLLFSTPFTCCAIKQKLNITKCGYFISISKHIKHQFRRKVNRHLLLSRMATHSKSDREITTKLQSIIMDFHCFINKYFLMFSFSIDEKIIIEKLISSMLFVLSLLRFACLRICHICFFG